MMGLERLFTNLYGAVPALDMDKQTAKCRVPKPMSMDFNALADGITRNNVGTAAIRFEVVAEIRGGEVVIEKTGQKFPYDGPVPAEAGAVKRTFAVLDWEKGARLRLAQ